MVFCIIDESEERDSAWFDAKICFEIIRGCKGRGLDAVDFSEFLEIGNFPVGKGEENMAALFIIFEEEILRMHPRHCGTQPRRFFAREDGWVIEALEGDVVLTKKSLDVGHDCIVD